jgi:hypothetical protein
MVRTQIQLTEEQAARLKTIAARTGVSVAELIRKSVDALFAREGGPTPDDTYERAARASGRFSSEAGDVSIRHDQYLADAYKR